MKKHNITLLIALFLTSVAFFAHAIAGDLELFMIQPTGIDSCTEKQQVWTMARAGWHMISFDLLFTSIILAPINFSTFFSHPKTVLNLLGIYFLGYAIAFLFIIIISPPFPNNFLKLGQWILLFSISSLIYWGRKKQPAETCS